jgi:hypothetical protein
MSAFQSLGLRDGEDQGKPAPSLDIEKTLDHMFPFPLGGDDTHLICSKSLKGNQFVVVIQKLGIDGRIW